MERRKLGKTGMEVSLIGFGASSIGAEFRQIDLNEATQSVRTALECGINLIDTSPYYGRGLSESLLGISLRDVPRDNYILCTKLGRYTPNHFDFSARRVAESIDTSLERLKTDHLDIVLCHDVEFVDLSQIIQETIPAIRKQQEQGKVRFVGISGYPMHIFREVASKTELDVVLSYNHYTIQNTMLADNVDFFKSRNIGIMNAAPFSARLLTKAALPAWHKATQEVRSLCQKAAAHCDNAGVDIAKLALQFSIGHPEFATCIAGSANPDRIRQWCDWADEPLNEELLHEVQEILRPIHNWFYIEGLSENNDALPV